MTFSPATNHLSRRSRLENRDTVVGGGGIYAS